MATQPRAPTPWAKLPTSARAILSGLLLALVATNVWPLLLLNLSVPLATIAEDVQIDGASLCSQQGDGFQECVERLVPRRPFQ